MNEWVHVCLMQMVALLCSAPPCHAMPCGYMHTSVEFVTVSISWRMHVKASNDSRDVMS